VGFEVADGQPFDATPRIFADFGSLDIVLRSLGFGSSNMLLGTWSFYVRKDHSHIAAASHFSMRASSGGAITPPKPDAKTRISNVRSQRHAI
jgi:hypothetical protein